MFIKTNIFVNFKIKTNNILKNELEQNSESKLQLLLSTMTNEEKVGQLFIYAYRKDKTGKNIHYLNNELKTSIKKYNLGGVLLFSENMQSAEQLKKLTSDIYNTNKKIPLFISVDVEGGIVDRLSKSLIVSNLPYISKLGNTNDTNLSYEYGKIIGRRLAYLGFNLNFSPVCDLDNSNVIKYRSFGKNPILVGKMIEAYIKGMHEYNIGSTLKHFPGLGSSINDTHKYISYSNITLKNLEENDFIPFQYGINSGSKIVMINHVIYNKLSDLNLPASLDKNIYNLLRNKLNFTGIVITDGLEMNAITKQNIDTTPAYAAFVAGADILLLPENIETSYNEILIAVNRGIISEERLNNSVEKILKYKEELNLLVINKIDINLYDENDQKTIDLINNY